MIARVWRARTGGPGHTADYRRVFEGEVLGHLRGVAGFHGAYLLARQGAGGGSGEAMEIATVTLFDSYDAVRRFAGDDHERAQITPAARATLLDSDPVVRHFAVLTAFAATASGARAG